MPSIVTPLLRWTVPTILTLFLPFSASQAQKAERYSISGGDVAIYNLAGPVKVEAGCGVVPTEVTPGGAGGRVRGGRGGAGGGERVRGGGGGGGGGWVGETGRLLYPADRIQYSRL